MIENITQAGQSQPTLSANRPLLEWIARLLILPVFGWNIQCAVLFLLEPDNYSAGFSLSGISGAAVIRSLGLLFVMWNIPYLLALLRPIGWRICLVCAVLQQAIGLAGETFIRAQAGSDAVLQASVGKFILFDGAGLALLLLALFVVIIKPRKDTSHV